MPADALNYFYVAKELNTFLKDGRIDKIMMPENDQIVLLIRAQGKNRSLLISANASQPRCHLTEHSFTSPLTAPAFLMHLRKHLSGATVQSFELIPYERILVINLVCRNELGYTENKKLIAEIMGKYSNVILVNADGKISDCMKHVSLDTSAKRQVLPGLSYALAPPQNKINPSQAEEFKHLLAAFEGGRIDKYLLEHVSGLAPSTISEAVFRALGQLSKEKTDEETIEKIYAAFKQLYFEKKNPCVTSQDGKYRDFAFMPYETVSGERLFLSTLNQALDAFYHESDRGRRLSEKAHNLTSMLKNAIARNEKKLLDFSKRRSEAEDLEHDKLYGELITANIYRIKQGVKSFTADNYYADPPQQILVPLDENKSPQFNAQRYYKKYAKKKKTLEVLLEQSAQAERDLNYYRSIEESFRTITENSELDEIAEEMANAGIVPAVQKKGASKKMQPSAPHKFIMEGFTVFVGHNNVQNDRITKAAKPDDVWLHTQKIHGAHVIVQNPNGGEVPQTVLYAAAESAAYNSKAYLSEQVPVDYTLCKHVSKPKGAALGQVIYNNQRTLYVKPQKHE